MAQEIEIREITSGKEMMDFIRFPWKVYAQDTQWVPPLIMDRKKFFNAQKNPFFRENPSTFYLAVRNGEILGRIAAIKNLQHKRVHQDRVGFFGFLEAVQEEAVFRALLEAVQEWLQDRGCDTIRGPVNPSTNDEVGFLLEGFDSPPYFMMPHTPPYYLEMMTALGYQKAKDLLAYFVDDEMLILNNKLKRVSEMLRKRYPLKVRPVNLKCFEAELQIVQDIYNDAWERNWGFVPMTPEEIKFIANDFKQIVNSEIVYIGEYNGEPIGFFLAMPNYNEVFKKIPDGKLFPFGMIKFLLNRKKIRGIRVMAMGIKQQYQSLGLGALFYDELVKRALGMGFRHAEMSWILEDNHTMNKIARQFGGKVHKKYRVYEKTLAEA